MFKPSVMKNSKRAIAKGVKGNLRGEGRLLGGLLVVGGDGVAFEHREAVSNDVALKLSSAVIRLCDHVWVIQGELFRRRDDRKYCHNLYHTGGVYCSMQ